ncbi:MAG: hypothetical protein ACW99Q_09555 [Candidatus Kariarchaeaceae archaeon]
MVSYLCTQCGVKRDAVLDEDKHLKRRELNTSGLAPYVDIHENIKKPDEPEHGMQIFVDINFHVRSNHPMSKKREKPKLSIPGIPAPTVSINQIKLQYNSNSWNSLNLTCTGHKVGFFIINTDPTINLDDGVIADFEAQLKSVSLQVNYRTSHLTKEFITMSHKWLHLLSKWIENTASLNLMLLPRLLIYIDNNGAKEPDTSDELSLSILIDSSAAIKLSQHVKNLAPIKHSINLLLQQWKNFKFTETVLGLNVPIYEFILSVLNSDNHIEIVELLDIVSSVDEKTKNQFIDTFILIFFDLFRANNLDFMVSHLL